MIVNDKERLQLEEELLMTCSKAQAINKYIDELEESSKLSELWCKSQQENARLKDKIKDLEEWLEAMASMYENEYKDVNASEHYKCMLHKLKEN